MENFVLPAIAILLIVAYIVDKIVTRKPKPPKDDKYPFDEEDCYNGRYDRNSKRFRD